MATVASLTSPHTITSRSDRTRPPRRLAASKAHASVSPADEEERGEQLRDVRVRGSCESGRRALLAMSVVGAAPFANVNTLSNTTAAASAAEETVTLMAEDITTPPPPPRRPTACTAGTSCVSTASFKSPANFLPPWEYTSSDADAFTELTRVVGEKPGSVITSADEGAGYVAATVRYGTDDVDDVEFYFTRDGSKTVLFASRSRVNKASPPGCFTPGCINGPRNRGRLEELQRELGWLPLETDEDKKWVPLLLH